MEKNELVEIWKELRRDDFAYLHLFPFEELRYIVPRLIWQLKAKMDLQDALIKEQKKQILSMETDMEWFYNKGQVDHSWKKNDFKNAWKIYSYGLKKGEKRG